MSSGVVSLSIVNIQGTNAGQKTWKEIQIINNGMKRVKLSVAKNNLEELETLLGY